MTRSRARVERVLITADPIGGVWTYTIELAAQLADRGIDIALATMGAPLSALQRRQVADLRRVSLHESTFKLEWMDDPWDDVDAAGEWLLDLAARVRPDIVHLSSMSHGALAWSVPCLVVAHSCVLSWWEAVRRQPAPASLKTYHERVQRGLTRADAVVAPSASMLHAITRLYGSLPRTGVIWNARAARHFAPRLKEPFVLGAGRVWDDAKNLAALDRAAEHLPWSVRIAGDLSAPDGTTRTLQSAEWLGVLAPEQMASVLGRASIYASPVYYEPFGLSALEAAHSECALVLGDIPSLREVWRNTAIFVPPHDDSALVDAIKWLIAHPSSRLARAAAARARALRWSPRLMASEYLGWYGAVRASKVA